MTLESAMAIIEQMARSKVTGISFTAGEPLIFFEDMTRLVRLCHERDIYSRVVTNCLADTGACRGHRHALAFVRNLFATALASC